ncbi:hypothetical protein [Streptomyces sp. NPDC051109]|uniref:hypothetical protein n=1 Tax=Streptomyces sp. NPDC051109 TaxID=3365642 RepID=UPI001AB02101
MVQTRRWALVQDRWPDLMAAAKQLPHGLVLDGELVVWNTEEGQLLFTALQRRAAARARSAPARVRSLAAGTERIRKLRPGLGDVSRTASAG